MRVALVYDRVNKWGGAERVLLALHELFPEAPLYTSVYNRESAEWADVFPAVHTSFLQNIPFGNTKHELLATLMPLAFESFNFDKFDLVVSVSSEAAKGVITKPNTKHICYMLTPTRYLWSGYDEYFKNIILKGISYPIINYLKKWDVVAANRPDKIISISNTVKDRIKRYYNRDSEFVFPPVDLEDFQKSIRGKLKKHGEYYLVVGRMVGYKRIDLVIKAFNILGKKLIVVGTGKEENRLKRIADDNILFENRLTDEELTNYYSNAKALVFPQIEDFGLVAVEAQACGTPVIAYARGGAMDTVIEGETGVLFEKQSVHGLVGAIRKFNSIHFDKNEIVKNAERFSQKRFTKEFMNLVKSYI